MGINPYKYLVSFYIFKVITHEYLYIKIFFRATIPIQINIISQKYRKGRVEKKVSVLFALYSKNKLEFYVITSSTSELTFILEYAA